MTSREFEWPRGSRARNTDPIIFAQRISVELRFGEMFSGGSRRAPADNGRVAMPPCDWDPKGRDPCVAQCGLARDRWSIPWPEPTRDKVSNGAAPKASTQPRTQTGPLALLVSQVRESIRMSCFTRMHVPPQNAPRCAAHGMSTDGESTEFRASTRPTKRAMPF
jgi:hypothetical protein